MYFIYINSHIYMPFDLSACCLQCLVHKEARGYCGRLYIRAHTVHYMMWSPSGQCIITSHAVFKLLYRSQGSPNKVSTCMHAATLLEFPRVFEESLSWKTVVFWFLTEKKPLIFSQY